MSPRQVILCTSSLLMCMSRLTAEVMMDEISKRPGPNFHDQGYASRSSHHRVEGSAIGFNREGYALAAGLALGLITLGQGLKLGSLADLNLPERLRCAFAHM